MAITCVLNKRTFSHYFYLALSVRFSQHTHSLQNTAAIYGCHAKPYPTHIYQQRNKTPEPYLPHFTLLWNSKHYTKLRSEKTELIPNPLTSNQVGLLFNSCAASYPILRDHPLASILLPELVENLTDKFLFHYVPQNKMTNTIFFLLSGQMWRRINKNIK